MGSGHFWQGHLSLLTFLTQFPRKLLFMCTWKQEADLRGGNWMTQRRLPLGPAVQAELGPEQPGHKEHRTDALSSQIQPTVT